MSENQSSNAADFQLTPKPSFLERKLPKGKPDIIPSLPFHSVGRARFSNILNKTIELPLTASLGELNNKDHMAEMVRRKVLFRNPSSFENTNGKKRSREESDESECECSDRQDSGFAPQTIICIKNMGSPKCHRQVKGQSGVSAVSFILPVEVVVATVTYGICPGIVREEAPFPGVSNVEVTSDADRVIVTCICPEEEPVAKGQTVLVAVEPSCLRVQIFRPPRISRGKFQKKVDIKVGQTEITFIPDFDGDAKVREAAEAKNAEAAAAT